MRRDAARFAEAKAVRQQHAVCAIERPAVGERTDQQLDALAADVVVRLGDGAERGREVFAQRDAVEADDAQIAGTAGRSGARRASRGSRAGRSSRAARWRAGAACATRRRSARRPLRRTAPRSAAAASAWPSPCRAGSRRSAAWARSLATRWPLTMAMRRWPSAASRATASASASMPSTETQGWPRWRL